MLCTLSNFNSGIVTLEIFCGIILEILCGETTLGLSKLKELRLNPLGGLITFSTDFFYMARTRTISGRKDRSIYVHLI